MKYFAALFIILIIIQYNIIFKSENIDYIKFYHDRGKYTICIDALLQDSTSCSLGLDSASPWDLILDSTFFFNNFSDVQFTLLDNHSPIYGGEVKVDINHITYTANKILVLNLKNNNVNIKLDGIIGAKLFESKITYIDFTKRKIAFEDYLIVDSSYTAIPMSRANNDKFRSIKMHGFKDIYNHNLELNLVVDIANLTSGVALKKDIVISNPKRRSKKINMRFGASPFTDYDLWLTDSLSLGNFSLNNIKTSQSTNRQYDNLRDLSYSDGLLGMPVLKFFDIILDYKSDSLYVKPNLYYYSDTTYYTHPEEF